MTSLTCDLVGKASSSPVSLAATAENAPYCFCCWYDDKSKTEGAALGRGGKVSWRKGPWTSGCSRALTKRPSRPLSPCAAEGIHRTPWHRTGLHVCPKPRVQSASQADTPIMLKVTGSNMQMAPSVPQTKQLQAPKSSPHLPVRHLWARRLPFALRVFQLSKHLPGFS